MKGMFFAHPSIRWIVITDRRNAHKGNVAAQPGADRLEQLGWLIPLDLCGKQAVVPANDRRRQQAVCAKRFNFIVKTKLASGAALRIDRGKEIRTPRRAPPGDGPINILPSACGTDRLGRSK
jgi:hypothetical protein